MRKEPSRISPIFSSKKAQ